ncbi:hypothetical protein D3C86_2031760 [compost metagenome]
MLHRVSEILIPCRAARRYHSYSLDYRRKFQPAVIRRVTIALFLDIIIFSHQTLKGGITLLLQDTQHKITVDVQNTHRQTI